MNMIARPGHTDNIEPGRQSRRHNISCLTILLPPDLTLAIRFTAKKSGISPESLITDVLRDIFEPVLTGRGEGAVRKLEDRE